LKIVSYESSFNGSIKLNERKFEISGTIKDATLNEMDHSGFQDHDEGFLMKPDKPVNAFFELDILSVEFKNNRIK
jgi:hypothetical protein